MQNRGETSPFDEMRAAWRPRVNLSHMEFEILLRDHLKLAPNGFARAAAETGSSLTARDAIHASIRTLATLPDITERLTLADRFADDNHMGGDLRDALRVPYEAAPNPARLAWAGLMFINAVQDFLPKNYWCSHAAMMEATQLAVDNHEHPGAHFYASKLCAYYHMQTVNAALPHLTKTLRETGHYNLAAVASHLYTRQKSTMNALRHAAEHTWRTQIPANSNILPFIPAPKPF